MSSFRIRPHIRESVDWDLGTAQERLVERLGRGGSRCVVMNFPGYLTLRIPDGEQHFWSPQLTISLEGTEDGQTRLEGLYGPNTSVWSMYLYGYLGLGTAGLFAGVFGISQWLAGTRPWALWILAGVAVGAIGFYVMAQLGQKLGAQQTFQLHQELEAALGRSVRIH
ncbi:MAG: hypothetical protein ACKV19_27590 [Verrucomicrobiales bacterium]